MLNQKENTEGKRVLGMVMLRSETGVDTKDFFKDLQNRWGSRPEKPHNEGETLIFEMEGATILIAHMPFPVPPGDIEGTAKYAYNWRTAAEDLKTHKSHLLVSVADEHDDSDAVNNFTILTQVICSLLGVTDAIGVYMGGQSLLIPKAHYLEDAEEMDMKNLPVHLWVYFGLRTGDSGNSGYTYGLQAFGKKEIEILDTSLSPGDIKEILMNIAHYVIRNNVTLKHGQTMGASADERIDITVSEGVLVEGETVKLAY